MFELASRRQWAWLADELAQWTKDGIITDDQQQRILDKYGRHGATSADSTYQTDARQTSIVVRIVAPLGALMIGAGVIMLLAHNWKSMAVWLKLALAGSAMVAAYGEGYWLAFERRTHAAVGRALILLGILLFGANIWLAAQVFNISADSSGGVLLWAISALLVAHVLQDRPVAYLSMALLTLWTVLDHAQRVDPRSYLFPMIMAGAGLPLVLSLKSPLPQSRQSCRLWYGWQSSSASKECSAACSSSLEQSRSSFFYCMRRREPNSDACAAPDWVP